MHTPPEGETRSLPRIRIQAEPGEVVPGRRLVPEETQRQHEALRPRIEPGSEYQERIENLERKVEELREQLEGLRGSRDSKKPAEESTET